MEAHNNCSKGCSVDKDDHPGCDPCTYFIIGEHVKYCDSLIDEVFHDKKNNIYAITNITSVDGGVSIDIKNIETGEVPLFHSWACLLEKKITSNDIEYYNPTKSN